MPTLPNRFLRHQKHPPSPDNLNGSRETHLRRSFDEPDHVPGSGSIPSRSPARPYVPLRYENTPQIHKSHTRSRSHPFPSLFSTSKRKGDGLDIKGSNSHTINDDDEDDDDDYAPQYDGTSSPVRRKTVSSDSRRLEEKDTETGNCMTCDSKVKWPKGLKTFRCAVCLTVNDLERWNRQLNNPKRQNVNDKGDKIGHQPHVTNKSEFLQLSESRSCY